MSLPLWFERLKRQRRGRVLAGTYLGDGISLRDVDSVPYGMMVRARRTIYEGAPGLFLPNDLIDLRGPGKVGQVVAVLPHTIGRAFVVYHGSPYRICTAYWDVELEPVEETVARRLVYGPVTGPHNERLKLLVEILGIIDLDVFVMDLPEWNTKLAEELSVELIDMLLAPVVPTPEGWFD